MSITAAWPRLAAVALLATAGCATAPVAAQRTDSAEVIVAYHSVSGHTRRMAEAVLEGARSVAGVAVTLASIEEVTPARLEAADGIVVGSPTHWGTSVWR